MHVGCTLQDIPKWIKPDRHATNGEGPGTRGLLQNGIEGCLHVRQHWGGRALHDLERVHDHFGEEPLLAVFR